MMTYSLKKPKFKISHVKTGGYRSAVHGKLESLDLILRTKNVSLPHICTAVFLEL